MFIFFNLVPEFSFSEADDTVLHFLEFTQLELRALDLKIYPFNIYTTGMAFSGLHSVYLPLWNASSESVFEQSTAILKSNFFQFFKW
jgi:hypothetical protein